MLLVSLAKISGSTSQMRRTVWGSVGACSSSLFSCQQGESRPRRRRDTLRVAGATWRSRRRGPTTVWILPAGKKTSSPTDHLIHAGLRANCRQRKQNDGRVERFRRRIGVWTPATVPCLSTADHGEAFLSFEACRVL